MSRASGERRTISQAGERRSAHIESMRGIGAILVVLAHVGTATFALHPTVLTLSNANDFAARTVYGAGNAALYLFFAISGFVIYFPFAKRDFARGGGVDLLRYATNRALRIFPLYYVVVVVVLLAQFQNPPYWVWEHFLTFTQNFSNTTALQYVGVSWSLVVELHFYILLPFLAWGIARIARGSVPRGLAVVIGIGLISLAFRVAQIYAASPPTAVWRSSTLAAFLFIAAGMAASIVHVSWSRQQPSWLRGLLTRSDLWLLAALLLVLPFMYVSYTYDFLCPIMAFLIIGAASFPGLQRGPVTGVLWWRPLAVIGISAYSIYLWHLPLIHLVIDQGIASRSWGFLPLTALVLPLSLAVGWLSYRIIEEPFLRLRKRWSPAAPPQEQQRAAPQETPAS